MKKFINGALFLALVGMVMVGCEKEENLSELSSKGNQEFTKLDIRKNKSSEITYISKENFESEFESFSDDFFSNNSLGSIEIFYDTAQQQFELTTMEIGPFSPGSGERIICHSQNAQVVINCQAMHQQFSAVTCQYTFGTILWSDGSGRVTYFYDVQGC